MKEILLTCSCCGEVKPFSDFACVLPPVICYDCFDEDGEE